MKHILLLPLAALAMVSCDALTTPVYLTGEAPVETKTENATPTSPVTTAPVIQQKPTTASRTTDLPETLPAGPQANTPRNNTIRRSGNFVQPDVLAIPKKDDLKETATSTETAPPPPSITVPADQ